MNQRTHITLILTLVTLLVAWVLIAPHPEQTTVAPAIPSEPKNTPITTFPDHVVSVTAECIESPATKSHELEYDLPLDIIARVNNVDAADINLTRLVELKKDTDAWVPDSAYLSSVNAEVLGVPPYECDNQAMHLSDWLNSLGRKTAILIGRTDHGYHAWVEAYLGNGVWVKLEPVYRTGYPLTRPVVRMETCIIATRTATPYYNVAERFESSENVMASRLAVENTKFRWFGM